MRKILSSIINTDIDIEISGIKTNSKDVKPGDLFICTKGVNVDRHDYIDDAINNGAVCLITAHEVDTNIPYIIVKNPDDVLFEILNKFYDYPLKKLKLFAITGTDGKTSTCQIIQHLIGNDICGYIGTTGYSCKQFDKETDNTTPAIDKLMSYFYEFVEAGCKYVAMEASSESFYYHRLDNLIFEASGYTNVTSEHLNTHKTIENYIACKKRLFDLTKGICIYNSNDQHFDEFVINNSNYKSYGYKESDDLYIKDYLLSPNYSKVNIIYQKQEYSFTTNLLGKFNIENLSLALLLLLENDFEINMLMTKLNDINVKGRMMSLNYGQEYHVIVDYAHTPNGLIKLFEFVKTLDVNKIIVVIGQAGRRDTSKRKEVGRICDENADYMIFTADDPRDEDTMETINMIAEGVKDNSKFEAIIDRESAVKKALSIANKNDLVLLLGKGHEKYQKMANGKKLYYNEIETAINYLKEKS